MSSTPTVLATYAALLARRTFLEQWYADEQAAQQADEQTLAVSPGTYDEQVELRNVLYFRQQRLLWLARGIRLLGGRIMEPGAAPAPRQGDD